MGHHMKTTVEISDALLAEAKRVAVQERTSVRTLIEQGLRQAIAQRKQQRGRFQLRKASFKGRGLSAAGRGGWAQMRELAYEGRGG